VQFFKKNFWRSAETECTLAGLVIKPINALLAHPQSPPPIMKPKSKFLALLLVCASALAATQSQAASHYWDANGATPGAGGPAPDGSWTTDGTTWSTSADGTLDTSALTTTADDDLIFAAGTDATGSYTVTLADSQLAKSLTFRSGTATISGTGGGVINLGGTGAIQVANGPTATPLTAVIGNNTDTILSGFAGLTKSGVGTLTLNGTSLHTFTGDLNLNGGTLALDFSNLATPTDFIPIGTALSFGGGALTLTGKDLDNTAQTFGSVTVNSGGGDFRVNPNNSASTTVTLGSLTTAASGGSLIIGRALGSGTGTLFITTATDKDPTDIYGGRVVFADGTINTGYDWATSVYAGPGSYELSAYTGYTALDLTEGTDTANSLVTASAAMTGSRTTNSLKFAPTVSAQTLALGAGNTLTLASGGLLMTSGQTNMNVNEGSITAGDGFAPADLVVHQFNPSQQLGIGITGGNLGNTPEIASNIVNNGDQPVTLVKNGPGSIRFMGNQHLHRRHHRQPGQRRLRHQRPKQQPDHLQRQRLLLHQWDACHQRRHHPQQRQPGHRLQQQQQLHRQRQRDRHRRAQRRQRWSGSNHPQPPRHRQHLHRPAPVHRQQRHSTGHHQHRKPRRHRYVGHRQHHLRRRHRQLDQPQFRLVGRRQRTPDPGQPPL
jgi:autotransporter-associated beta strand protein